MLKVDNEVSFPSSSPSLPSPSTVSLRSDTFHFIDLDYPIQQREIVDQEGSLMTRIKGESFPVCSGRHRRITILGLGALRVDSVLTIIRELLALVRRVTRLCLWIRCFFLCFVPRAASDSKLSTILKEDPDNAKHQKTSRVSWCETTASWQGRVGVCAASAKTNRVAHCIHPWIRQIQLNSGSLGL